MSSKPTRFTEDLQRFTLENGVGESDVLKRLREETSHHPMAEMQISPVQGAFMGLLVTALDATNVLEIGTFTGYSSLAMAEAMHPEGRIVTCDVNEKYTEMASRYWKEAGVDERVELRLGEALDTLDDMLSEGLSGVFDMAFIDADKVSYPAYYERVLRLLRPKGVILLDNMFMDGRIVDPANEEEGVLAIRALWSQLQEDERIDFTVVPIADGLGICVKR